jgi:hypothetical protein
VSVDLPAGTLAGTEGTTAGTEGATAGTLAEGAPTGGTTVAGGAWIWPSLIWEMGWMLAWGTAAATAAKRANEARILMGWVGCVVGVGDYKWLLGVENARRAGLALRWWWKSKSWWVDGREEEREECKQGGSIYCLYSAQAGTYPCLWGWTLDALACVHHCIRKCLHKTGRLVFRASTDTAQLGSRISVSSICSKAPTAANQEKSPNAELRRFHPSHPDSTMGPNADHYPVRPTEAVLNEQRHSLGGRTASCK